LLAANYPERYSAVLARARKQGIPLYKVEMEHLGYTHAELGGGVLGMWGLALPQVEAVALHHQPEPGPEAPPSVRRLVCRANRTVRELAQQVQPAQRQFCSAG
jgi:HD-like signal output (HDOD) protein